MTRHAPYIDGYPPLPGVARRTTRCLTAGLLLVCCMACPVRAEEGELPLWRFRVPKDKLQNFLPKSEVAVSRTKEELDRLLKRYEENRKGSQAVKPVACKLEGTLDVPSRRLIGTSTWTIPDSDSGSIELGPWNLTLRSWQGATNDAVAGLDSEGKLRIIGAPPRSHTIAIDWSLTAVGEADRLLFEGQIPNCAVSSLVLDLPAGWQIRTQSSVRRHPDGKTELFLGGSSTLSLEILAPAALDQGRSVLACQNDQTYRLDESGVQLEAILQLEALHEPVSSISLLFDENFRPQELVESTPAQWTREAVGDGRARWKAEFRRPPIGSFQVRVRGALPLTEGVVWRPPAFQVEDALPRGETMTFSVAPTLRIEAISPGNYEQTFAGQAEDQQYRLVFTSTGGIAERNAAPQLQPRDLTNLPSLARAILQQAEGADASPGKRIAELLDPAVRPLLEDAAAGETLGDAAVRTVLSELNRLLARPDLYSDAAFRTVQLRASVRQRIGKDQATASPLQLMQLNRWILEDTFPREIARRGMNDELPGIVVVSGRPDVEVGQKLLLDLRREQVALIADVYWRPVQGILFQPTLSIPAGWLVSRVVAEPEGRLLRYRSEPSEDGRSTLWLQLSDGLRPGDQFRAAIYAEPAQRNLLTEAPQQVTLPEIVPLEFPLTGTSLYTLYLDSILSYGKEQLPPPRSEEVEIRGLVPPAEANRYSFGFVSPLAEIKLGILAERARFVAEHAHRIEQTQNRWNHLVSIDIQVEQGLLPSIDVIATKPLPEDLEWQVEGGDNAVERVLPLPSPEGTEEGLHRYRIELAVPVQKRTRLMASWDSPGATQEVPLIDVPECDRFQAFVDVASASGQMIEVQSKGLIDAEPRSTDDVAATTVLWTAAYVRLPQDARVVLAVPPRPRSLQAIGNGQAVLRVHTFCQDRQLIQRVSIRLDCRSRRALTLNVPGDSHLWAVMLDGQPVQPRVFDGMIEISDNLAEGPHSVEVVYAHRPRRWLGLPVAEYYPPLVGWKLLSAIWTVERSGDAIAVPSSQLVEKGCYGISAGKDATICTDPSSKEGAAQAELVRSLGEKFAALDRKLLVEPLRVLGALQQALPPDWILVVDREALHGRGTGSLESAETFEEWLALQDWTVTIEQRCLLIAAAELSIASHASEAGGEGGWLDTLVASVKNQGVDPTGRFATPATLASESDEDFQAAFLVPSGRFSLEDRSVRTYELVETPQGGPVTVAFLPRAPLRSFARLTAILAAVFVYVWLRRARTHRLREVAGGTLLALVLLQMTGGVLQQAFTLTLWGAALVALALLIQRWKVLPRLPAALVILVGLSAPLSAEETERHLDRYRVLIPYDPQQLTKEPDRVVVSDWLLNHLEQGARRKNGTHLVTRADYEGILEANEQIFWRGRLEVYTNPENSFPYPVSLDLGSARVEGVSVDGEPVAFLPPGINARLDFKLVNPGLSTVQIEFVTPITGLRPERESTFRTPPAPITDVRLLMGERDVTLTEECLPLGMAQKNEEGRITFSGRGGPSNQVVIRWREGQEQATPPERIAVRTAHLLNISPPTQDMFSVFRFELSNGAVNEMNFLLPPDLVVRRLEAPGLASWHVLDQDAQGRRLELSFESLQTVSFDVHLHTMIPISDEERVHFPSIVPLGISAEEGAIGIRLPPGWTQHDEKFRNAEPVPVERFVERWKQLGQVPPDGIAIAKQFVTRPLELQLSLKRPEARWSLSQQINVRPSPHSGLADVTATVQLEEVRGTVQQVKLTLPNGFEVHRVTGDGLHQWFVTEGTLTLLPLREIDDGWQVRVSGRYLFGARGGQDAAVVDLAPFLAARADRAETRWAIERPPSHTLQIESPRDVTVSESGTDLILVTGDAPAHSFRLLLRPIEPRVEIRSVTMATVDDSSMVLDGRFDIDFAQGAPERLEFRAPRHLTNIQWTASEMKPPRSEVRGRDLVWILEPQRSRSGPFRIDWQFRLPRSGMERLSVPDVSLLGYAASHRLILLYNLSEARLEPADITGVSPLELPPDFSSWPAGVAVPGSLAKVSAFRVENEDWRLSLLPRRNRRSESPIVVNSQEIDLHFGEEGGLAGACRWETVDQSAGIVEIEIPEAYRIDELSVGGIALPYPMREKGCIRFPLFRRGAAQDIFLYWSVDAEAVKQGPVVLPRLATGGELPTTLLAIHHPQDAAWTFENKGGQPLTLQAVHRARWLSAKLRRVVDSLSLAFADWESFPTPQVEERLILLLARAELLSLQLREALAMLPSTTDGTGSAAAAEVETDFQRLLQRRDDLVVRFDAKTMVRRASLRMGSWEDFQWTQMHASGDATAYYVLIDGMPESMTFVRGGTWEPLRLSAQATIEVLTALFLMAAVLMPSLWPMLRVYWPAVMLLLGVGWLHLGEQQLVGWLLAAVAVGAAAWIIQGWFTDSEPEIVAEDSDPTRIALGTSLSG